MLKFMSSPIASAVARPAVMRAPFASRYGLVAASRSYATAAASKTAGKTAGKKPAADAAAKEKAAAQKKIQDEKKKLTALKKRLAKEKATLKTLNKKLSEADKKHAQLIKSRKQKELKKQSAQVKKDRQKKLTDAKKEKALHAKAFKKFHKLNAYNFFIRENVSGETKLADAAKKFKSLSDSERATYEKRAHDYNEKMATIFKPKPKQPVFAYAAFLAEQFPTHYAAAGKDSATTFKNIANEWKKLSDAEKAAYKPDDKASQEYAKQLEAWKADRLKAYERFAGSTVSASA